MIALVGTISHMRERRSIGANGPSHAMTLTLVARAVKTLEMTTVLLQVTAAASLDPTAAPSKHCSAMLWIELSHACIAHQSIGFDMHLKYF